MFSPIYLFAVRNYLQTAIKLMCVVLYFQGLRAGIPDILAHMLDFADGMYYHKGMKSWRGAYGMKIFGVPIREAFQKMREEKQYDEKSDFFVDISDLQFLFF